MNKILGIEVNLVVAGARNGTKKKESGSCSSCLPINFYILRNIETDSTRTFQILTGGYYRERGITAALGKKVTKNE